MPVSLEEILNEMPEERRARVMRRADEIRAELRLRDLRRLRKLTQAKLSKKLKIGQEGVSRIEKRTDLYLSTLRGYVEAVGGELTLMVKFPDRPPVILAGFGESPAEDEKKPKKKAKSAPRSKPGKPRAA